MSGEKRENTASPLPSLRTTIEFEETKTELKVEWILDSHSSSERKHDYKMNANVVPCWLEVSISNCLLTFSHNNIIRCQFYVFSFFPQSGQKNQFKSVHGYISLIASVSLTCIFSSYFSHDQDKKKSFLNQIYTHNTDPLFSTRWCIRKHKI